MHWNLSPNAHITFHWTVLSSRPGYKHVSRFIAAEFNALFGPKTATSKESTADSTWSTRILVQARRFGWGSLSVFRYYSIYSTSQRCLDFWTLFNFCRRGCGVVSISSSLGVEGALHFGTLRFRGVEGTLRFGTLYFCEVEGALHVGTLRLCGIDGVLGFGT